MPTLVEELRAEDVSVMTEAADEIERLRAALDKIIGVALGRAHDLQAALVHKIAMEALARTENERQNRKSGSGGEIA